MAYLVTLAVFVASMLAVGAALSHVDLCVGCGLPFRKEHMKLTDKDGPWHVHCWARGADSTAPENVDDDGDDRLDVPGLGEA